MASNTEVKELFDKELGFLVYGYVIRNRSWVHPVTFNGEKEPNTHNY